MKKLIAALVAVLMLASVMAGCGSKDDGVLTVTVVAEGGLGDNGYCDSAAAGIERLVNEYGIEGKIVECDYDENIYEQQLLNAAEDAEFVVAIGAGLEEALVKTAEEQTATKFIYVDGALEGSSNLYSIAYAENEGGFLAGYIAGKLTDTGKIGAVGGADGEDSGFITGYLEGAKYANPGCETSVLYAGANGGEDKGGECALTLYDADCDVVFDAVGGAAGEGVVAAASKNGKYAICSGSDKKYIDPDAVICSVVKDIGETVYSTVSEYIDNDLWRGGEYTTAGVKSGFILVSYGDEGTTQQASDGLKAEVEAVRTQIISGGIAVSGANK